MRKNIESKETIADIAHACGVSAMTVSRALRNNPAVKEQTRKRILAAAEGMGYIRAPRMGRPSASGRTALKVQLIVGTLGRSATVFHTELVVSIEQKLSEHGCECLIRTCSGEYSHFIQLLENIRNSQVDISLLVGSFVPEQLKALLEALPDSVLLDDPGLSFSGSIYGSFIFDNVEAARMAVRHLLSCGRRRVLIVTGMAEHFFSREIEQGYREELAANKIELRENMILRTDFSVVSASVAVNAAIAAGLTFDAVFTNDEMASGVYRALFENNLRIPDDVSVCGCDGLSLGMHLLPRLTSVILDYKKLADVAVRHIIQDRERSRTHFRHVLIPFLEIRESTVPKKADKQ